MSFSGAEIRAVGQLLKVKQGWQLQHLAEVLPSVPETADLFRTAHFDTPPSKSEAFLQQVERDPARTLRRLLKPTAGEPTAETFERVLQQHDGSALLHYHVALCLSPTGHAEARLQDGSARRTLLDPELDIALITRAAQSAKASLAPRIRRGKGTDRRSGSTPQRLTVDHLLEIFTDVTGRLPGVTANTIDGRIQGPAVEFLRLVLPKARFPVPSGSTLRRWIADFRNRRGKSHQLPPRPRRSQSVAQKD